MNVHQCSQPFSNFVDAALAAVTASSLVEMMLPACFTCLWSVWSIPLCSTSPAPSGLMEALVHSHFQFSPEMVNQIQVWALAGPLQGPSCPEAILSYLGDVLRVIALLKDEPAQSEVKSSLEQVSIQDVSGHHCIHLSFYLDPSLSFCCWRISPQLDATTMLSRRDGTGLVVSVTWFP